MVNTPPPPEPAPGPDQADEHSGSAAGQGGLDRDVNSILANLNQEQLASIVAAARASGDNSVGENITGSSGVDASSILAAHPFVVGQAASALTSLTSSLKREAEGGAAEREEENEEGREEAAPEDETGVAPTTAEAAGDANVNEDGEQGQHEQQHEEDVAHDQQHEDKKDGEDESHQYTHVDEGDQSTQIGDDTGMTDDYRNENATQAAIAAMESLAAQSNLMHDIHGRAGSRGKRDTGPEAERVRKDQHKEVERKRREQISNGITELAAIVPGCDAKGINKTAIINAAVRYIVELKNNEASNIEKWTLEKLLMDQAMGDLNAQLDATRKELSRLRAQYGLPDEPLEIEQEQEQEQEQEHEHEHHEHHEGEHQEYAEELDGAAVQEDGQGGEEQLADVEGEQEHGAAGETAEEGVADAVEGEEAALDKTGVSAAAANALDQVAEAAVAAAAEAHQNGDEYTAMETDADASGDVAAEDLKAARGGRRRGNSDVEVPTDDVAGRIKRTKNA